MKREADHTIGPMALAVHMLVVCVAVAVTIWVQLGVDSLQNSSDEREAELLEFANLAYAAQRAPARDIEEVASEFRLRLLDQSWHHNLGSLRPAVVRTPAGLRLEIVTHSRGDLRR
jgi:hypothetical protein